MIKKYLLSYDSVADKDIAEWLSQLPNKRKASEVRNAIRLYMNMNNPIINNPSIPVEIKNETNTQKKPKINLNDIKKI